MLHCDIENYRDIESYCRIHSTFQIVNRLLPGLFFKNVRVGQGFANIFKSLQYLKVFET